MRKGLALLLMMGLLWQPMPVNAEYELPESEQVTLEMEEAPMSESFLHYRNDPGNAFSGYRPPLYRPQFSENEDEDLLGYQAQSNLPVSFDLREHNRVTPIRDQQRYNTCWAFASIAALESHKKPRDYDFSENHLANHSGYYRAREEGGNAWMGLAYYTSDRGPVDEAMDPYGSPSLVKDLPRLTQVRTAYEVGKKDIKEMIYRYGGVEADILGADPYSPFYNPTTSSQYVPLKYRSDHEVLIIGWDDNYPKENFLVPPPRNGAWIVKNSWGEDFGDKGYFYVSYEDKTLGSDTLMVYIDSRETKWYDHLYQHDEYGQVNAISHRMTKIHWFANVFTVKSSEEHLSAISFYANEPNLSYEVWVVDDYRGSFNSKKMVKSGTLKYAGYHTLDLNQQLRLNGTRFAVIVKVYGTQGYPVSVEENVPGYIVEAVSRPGESFISIDGDRWADLSKEGKNVCLKAFTINGEKPKPALPPQELQSARDYGKNLMTSDPAKTWTITFNQRLRSEAGEIKVYEDGSFREILVDARISGKKLMITPRESYSRGKDYYIYVGKVKSESGKVLTPIKAKFRVN